MRYTGFSRSSMRYESTRDPQEALCERIQHWAGLKPRWGYRFIHRVLRREGWRVNRKRVQRLYRAAGLAVRRRGKRKRMQMPRVVRNELTGINQRWSMDFVRDTLSNGRAFRCLNIIDEYSRECLAIEVSHSLPSARVIEVLERLRITRGLPAVMITDNGSEFTSRAFDGWAYARDVRLDYIEPGKPVQNCFVESFNGTFRDDCLNAHWFVSLDRARVTIETWRREYNEERPHSSLNDLTPTEYAEIVRPGDADRIAITSPIVRL
ncbi:MAG: IS3 family transposase [Longimicrobiales bacterium]